MLDKVAGLIMEPWHGCAMPDLDFYQSTMQKGWRYLVKRLKFIVKSRCAFRRGCCRSYTSLLRHRRMIDDQEALGLPTSLSASVGRSDFKDVLFHSSPATKWMHLVIVRLAAASRIGCTRLRSPRPIKRAMWAEHIRRRACVKSRFEMAQANA
jgi:hypothetical protein